MTSQAPGPGQARVVITGVGATSAYGRGAQALRDGVLAGEPAFGEVARFGTGRLRAHAAATLPGDPALREELAGAVTEACAGAGLTPELAAGTPLLVALHSDAVAARNAGGGHVAGGAAESLARDCGFAPPPRVYATACVAGTSAVADAAAAIVSGRISRAVVAAGFLVDGDSFALFDAGRALAVDGLVRPFSAGRKGMLLGDAAAAVVLESAAAAGRRGARPLATLAGWGRSGDAYHVCDPRPDGAGLARAIGAALARAGIGPSEVGYVNANGTGTPHSDAAESAALRRALGWHAGQVPVSSTKSLHGHALEASGLLEFVLTVLVLRAGRLPVNAGYLAPDADCDLNLVLGSARPARLRHALTVNAAFGGANTALLVEAA